MSLFTAAENYYERVLGDSWIIEETCYPCMLQKDGRGLFRTKRTCDEERGRMMPGTVENGEMHQDRSCRNLLTLYREELRAGVETSVIVTVCGDQLLRFHLWLRLYSTKSTIGLRKIFNLGVGT